MKDSFSDRVDTTKKKIGKMEDNYEEHIWK